MQLFHHPFCPHSRFVRLVLGEYGINVDLIEENALERRPKFLELNPAGTTWVCADNGQTASVWNLFNSIDLNKIFCFPITDDTKTYFNAQGKPKAYDVIGYVPLRIIAEFKDNNPKSNTLHLTLSWTGPQPCGTSGGGSSGFGAYEIGLSG